MGPLARVCLHGLDGQRAQASGLCIWCASPPARRCTHLPYRIIEQPKPVWAPGPISTLATMYNTIYSRGEVTGFDILQSQDLRVCSGCCWSLVLSVIISI